MPFLYVPDMGELNSDLNKSFLDSKPFVMWRGKPMPPQTLCKRWEKGGFIKHLSGMTLEPSMANLGVERWISSLEGFPVSPLASLVSNWEIKTQDTYGLLLSKSLAKCDPNTSSLRMFQESLDGSLAIFSTTLPNWGIMLHGVLWELEKLEPHTEETGGSYWRNFATPTVMDSTGLQRSMAKKSMEEGTWRGMDLKTTAILIPTPNAGDSKRFNLHHQGGPGNMTLHGHALSFPTPTTQANAQLKGQYSKNTGTTLAGFVRKFPTPTARDHKGPLSLNGRKKGYGPTLPCLAKSGELTGGKENSTNGGRLNPQWVAWLMGLPIGWIK